MIQFNLLPDVKLQFVKAKRTKRLVLVSAFIVSAASLSLMILLFLGVAVFQKQHLNDISKDIKIDTQKLRSTPDLDKVLTIQNQIGSLQILHDSKHVTSRFFGYINQVTPNTVTVSSASLDMKQGTITLEGDAPDISTINKFVDTLKFTTYKIDNTNSDSKNVFNSVVLASFALPSDKGSSKKATYQVTLKFEPVIFDITKTVTLNVPKQITTRSETEKPNLFQLNSVTGGQ